MPLSREKKAPDLGAQMAAELAFVHYLLQRADEFYRLAREALLTGEGPPDEPKPPEWIPLSKQ